MEHSFGEGRVYPLTADAPEPDDERADTVKKDIGRLTLFPRQLGLSFSDRRRVSDQPGCVWRGEKPKCTCWYMTLSKPSGKELCHMPLLEKGSETTRVSLKELS